MNKNIPTCVNIFDGSNLILPNATQVIQHYTAAEDYAAATWNFTLKKHFRLLQN